MAAVHVHDETEAYAEITKGNFIFGDRGIGKTKALLRVIHDKHEGKAVVLFARRELAQRALGMYRTLFGERSPYLIAISFQGARNGQLEGRSLPVYADDWDVAKPGEREHIEDMVRAIGCRTRHDFAGCL